MVMEEMVLVMARAAVSKSCPSGKARHHPPTVTCFNGTSPDIFRHFTSLAAQPLYSTFGCQRLQSTSNSSSIPNSLTNIILDLSEWSVVICCFCTPFRFFRLPHLVLELVRLHFPRRVTTLARSDPYLDSLFSHFTL